LRLKILKKLRTASLNPEFTGSYNKVYTLKLKTNVLCYLPLQSCSSTMIEPPLEHENGMFVDADRCPANQYHSVHLRLS